MKQLIFCICALLSYTLVAQDTYLHCGKLIDTNTGKIKNQMTVIVSGNKIKDVQKGYVEPASQNDLVIDLKSKTVMPGLIDMHVHIEGELNPKSYIEDYVFE